MSGYRDKDSGYLPPQTRDRPPTRLEWAAAIGLILMGGTMLARGIMGDASPRWLQRTDMWPIAISELVLAWLLWLRSRNQSPDERYSPRALRLTALLFVFLAAATIAVSYWNGSGA